MDLLKNFENKKFASTKILDPASTLSELGGVSNPLLSDLDLDIFVIKSTAGDVVLDATAVNGSDVVAKPDATGAFVVRQDGGTPGNDEGQFWHDGENLHIRNMRTGSGQRKIILDSEAGQFLRYSGQARIDVDNTTITMHRDVIADTILTRNIGSASGSYWNRVFHAGLVPYLQGINVSTTGVKNINYPNGSGFIKLCPIEFLIYCASGTWSSDVSLSIREFTGSNVYVADTPIFGGTPVVGQYVRIDVDPTKYFHAGDNAFKIDVSSAATGTAPVIKIFPLMASFDTNIA